MKKNHHLHRQIHLCLIILLLLFCSSSQVFAAARVNVKNTRIKLSATKLTYNKKVQRPKVRVTYKGKVLKEKKNYIVKYSKGCKKVGTYTVQIIGKGTYTGTAKKQFVILPPKAQIMNIYAKTATATVVVKRQTSQTSGYQLRYATNSKLKNAKTITVKGNKNNTICLNGLRAGTTYYMQTRTYMTVKGKKYYSKWSSTGHCTTNRETNSTHQSATPTPTPTPTSTPVPTPTPIPKADLPAHDQKENAPAKYTYEIYGLDKQKADIYTDCLKPFFIKTDNPDPNSFSLIFNGNDSRTSAYRSGSSRFFDDIPLENNDSETTSLEKVKGGYIKYVHFSEAGTYTVEFREYSLSGYTVANTVTLNVLDYEQAKNAWMIDIINKTTTTDMTPFEKMDAISAYLREPGRFKYLTRYNDHTVDLAADPNEPFFVTYRWNSSTSPSVLGEFAELVGGFDDIHYCFGDYPVGSPSWSIWHYVVKLTIGNETRNYAVCPMGSTGNIEEIKMIDFSDLSNMRKFG